MEKVVRVEKPKEIPKSLFIQIFFIQEIWKSKYKTSLYGNDIRKYYIIFITPGKTLIDL